MCLPPGTCKQPLLWGTSAQADNCRTALGDQTVNICLSACMLKHPKVLLLCFEMLSKTLRLQLQHCPWQTADHSFVVLFGSSATNNKQQPLFSCTSLSCAKQQPGINHSSDTLHIAAAVPLHCRCSAPQQSPGPWLLTAAMRSQLKWTIPPSCCQSQCLKQIGQHTNQLMPPPQNASMVTTVTTQPQVFTTGN